MKCEFNSIDTKDAVGRCELVFSVDAETAFEKEMLHQLFGWKDSIEEEDKGSVFYTTDRDGSCGFIVSYPVTK